MSLRVVISLRAEQDLAFPFHKHLIFHQAGDRLSIERIMHGARDLPERLVENPGT